jgi:hypothetical protein
MWTRTIFVRPNKPPASDLAAGSPSSARAESGNLVLQKSIEMQKRTGDKANGCRDIGLFRQGMFIALPTLIRRLWRRNEIR